MLQEIERFVGEFREQEAELERFLATVLFTDIVDSTTTVAALGDRRWKEMVEAHHARVRGQLARYRGKEIDTAGDGFLATFDGPARAIRCAIATVGPSATLGSRSGRACTPARSSRSATRSAGSPSISAPVSRPWPALRKSSPRRP